MKISFVLLDQMPLAELARLDPDRDWQQFVTGERAWILQTFLRLRTAGVEVELLNHLPNSGIAIFSAKQRHELRRRHTGLIQTTLIGVREDVGQVLFADYEIVQNGHQQDGERSFFIPFWPQPGLICRDAERGARLENIGFKGFAGNLHRDFNTAAWQASLASLGMRWIQDTVEYSGPATSSGTLAWNDYGALDLIVAVRPEDRKLYPRKPATKLYNAWLAHVPAMLGPELAYRELRRSALDYLEVTSAADALRQIRRLQEHPDLYLDMIRNGHERAQAFTAARIAQTWITFLTEVLPRQEAAAAHSITKKWWRGRSLVLRQTTRRIVNLTRRPRD